MKKDQNSNNNDKSNLSSARSESSKKTLISDDKFERSVYFLDVANMKGINILEAKNETRTSFEYLKNNLDEFFLGYPDIFDSELRKFFNYIASEEENNDYELLSKHILILPKNIFSFLHKHGDLYNFWINLLLKNINFDDVKLQRVEFLKNLMNGFKVYKKFKNSKKHNARDLYLFFLSNQNNCVNDIFLNTSTVNHNKEIYLQV